jgi:chromosome segregation ATPase
MGRTATSSQEHIYAAADALILAGKTPTLLAVREALGGGSMSTLSRTLSEWRQSREDKQTAETSSPDLPSAMKVLLESMGRAFWSEAVSLAGRDLQSIREPADKTAGEARQRLSDLEEALMVLEQERDRLEETISSLHEEASRLKDEWAASLVTLARETAWRDGRLQQMDQEVVSLREILKARTTSEPEAGQNRESSARRPKT